MSAPVAYVEVDDVESFRIEMPRAKHLKAARYRSLVLEIYVLIIRSRCFVYAQLYNFVNDPSIHALVVEPRGSSAPMTAISWQLSVLVREEYRSLYHQLQMLSIVQLGEGSRSA